MAVYILRVGIVNARLAGHEDVIDMYMSVSPCVQEPRWACTVALRCLCIGVYRPGTLPVYSQGQSFNSG